MKINILGPYECYKFKLKTKKKIRNQDQSEL